MSNYGILCTKNQENKDILINVDEIECVVPESNSEFTIKYKSGLKLEGVSQKVIDEIKEVISS